MTLGNKIRKYRKLNGLTQKEVGLKVGFSEQTADSRIRKYESDMMAPKAVLRNKLADALGVDLSALSEINVSTDEDVMQLLFQFEEDFGLEIEKRDGKTYISIDDNNNEIRTLITYMNIWRTQKRLLIPDSKNITKEQMRAYELWKSRFVGNTKDYFASMERAIWSHYKPLIESVERLYIFLGMNSDIKHLYGRMREAGLTVSVAYDSILSEVGFTFEVNEILSPPSEDAELLFAQFIAELNHLANHGATTRTELLMPDDRLTITYYWKEEKSL